MKSIIKPDATVYWYAGNQCQHSKAGHVVCPIEMLAPLNGCETQNYVGSVQLGVPMGKHSPWRATFHEKNSSVTFGNLQFSGMSQVDPSRLLLLLCEVGQRESIFKGGSDIGPVSFGQDECSLWQPLPQIDSIPGCFGQS